MPYEVSAIRSILLDAARKIVIVNIQSLLRLSGRAVLEQVRDFLPN